LTKRFYSDEYWELNNEQTKKEKKKKKKPRDIEENHQSLIVFDKYPQ